MAKQRRFTAGKGRITLTLQLVHMGSDMQVLLFGGRAHIGAVALASPPQNSATDATCVHFTLRHHREGDIALRVARCLSSLLHCTVCVSAGIHFDDISREEISVVETLADRLTQRCLSALTKG